VSISQVCSWPSFLFVNYQRIRAPGNLKIGSTFATTTVNNLSQLHNSTLRNCR